VGLVTDLARVGYRAHSRTSVARGGPLDLRRCFYSIIRDHPKKAEKRGDVDFRLDDIAHLTSQVTPMTSP
jgi:hypothetical protein